jgi:hypothetical protein
MNARQAVCFVLSLDTIADGSAAKPDVAECGTRGGRQDSSIIMSCLPFQTILPSTDEIQPCTDLDEGFTRLLLPRSVCL